MAARWKFKFNREHYAQLYGCSVRTVTRYAQEGYPLDDFEETKARIAGKTPFPSSPGVSADSSGLALGLKASIQRLQEQEARAYADYSANIGGEFESQKQKAWLAISEQLRKVEQSTPDIQEANRQSVSKAELRTVLTGLFLRFRQDLEVLPKRIARELVGKDEIAIIETLGVEIDSLISGLYSCPFLEEDSEGE